MSEAASTNPWNSLESFPGLSALPGVWQAALGEWFEAFNTLCLEKSPVRATSIPCPCGCGCLHSIIDRHDRAGAIAICRCDPPVCPDFPAALEAITPLRLNRPRLGRALAGALSCQPKIHNLNLAQTIQFGSWSCEQVPVILTIQSHPQGFRHVIAELAARLRRPFILFAPTADHLDAECQELLATAQAGFFSIESTFTLTDCGLLLARQAPGELLARFTPQPKEIEQDVAIRLMRLVSQFDSETSEVFRLYCVQGLSAARVARGIRRSKATVIRRLKVIRGKIGVDPRSLRTLSPHLEKAEHELADSRAAHIHRKRLIYDDSGAEGAAE